MEIPRVKHPLKSPSATFHALEYPAYLPFSSHQKKKQVNIDFHAKANLFAITLIRLWTPKQKGERTNFLPNYEFCTERQQLTERCMAHDVLPVHQRCSRRMNRYFHENLAQNLGALSLLNVIMSSGFDGRSLGIIVSPRTDELYFTQKLCSFWLGYFNSPSESALFETSLLGKKLMAFTLDPNQKKWWDDAFDRDKPGKSEIMLPPLFLNEMLETTLRILVTPNEFLQEVAKLTMGEDQSTTLFCKYFFNKINSFKDQFKTYDEVWTNYIEHQGLGDFEIYLRDVLVFPINGKLVIKNIAADMYECMLIKAMSQYIPNLKPINLMDTMINYTLDYRIACVHYFIDQANIYWKDVSSKPEHKIWIMLEHLMTNLHDKMARVLMEIEFSNKEKQFLNDFLIQSIQFKKNNTAIFLVLQNQAILNNIVLDSSVAPDVREWANHCLYYFSEDKTNNSLYDHLDKLPDNKIKPVPRRQRRPSFYEEKNTHELPVVNNQQHTLDVTEPRL